MFILDYFPFNLQEINLSGTYSVWNTESFQFRFVWHSVLRENISYIEQKKL